MQKVFIDCGFHHGEGLKDFINGMGINHEWQVFIFEPNPACEAGLRVMDIAADTGIKLAIHDAAVWINDGYVMFAQENHSITQSGSPADGKSFIDGWSSHISGSHVMHPMTGFELPIRVPCIDFAKFIMLLHQPDMQIYCKMDIEGAEFAVLRKMLEYDVVKYFKELWVEFHEQLIDGENLITKRELINELSKHTTVNEWH